MVKNCAARFYRDNELPKLLEQLLPEDRLDAPYLQDAGHRGEADAQLGGQDPGRPAVMPSAN